MLDNIKSNKTLWLIIGFLVVLVLTIWAAVSSIQQHSPRSAPENDVPTANQSLSSEELEKIAEAAVQTDTEYTENDDFSGLVDQTLLEQPIPEDTALLKDELSQLKEIQSQLNEQKDILNKQHQDADQLLKLKEEQVAALEKQLKNS